MGRHRPGVVEPQHHHVSYDWSELHGRMGKQEGGQIPQGVWRPLPKEAFCDTARDLVKACKEGYYIRHQGCGLTIGSTNG